MPHLLETIHEVSLIVSPFPKWCIYLILALKKGSHIDILDGWKCIICSNITLFEDTQFFTIGSSKSSTIHLNLHTNSPLLSPPLYSLILEEILVMDIMWPISQSHFYVSCFMFIKMIFIHCHSCVMFAMKSMSMCND